MKRRHSHLPSSARAWPALLAIALVATAGGAWAQTGSKVSMTRHNLSATGPGPVKVAGETRICRFCHTPHAANPIAPLWNRQDPGTYYQTYESSTLVAEVGQPTGTSRLCLSCHDGTIALTQTYNPRNSPQGSIYITPTDRGYIGTDLSDDHPISFVYDSTVASRKGQLRDPVTLPGELPLDNQNRLQCTTCHDAHNDQYGNFLKMDNTESRLCRSCHLMRDWAASSHATSSSSLASATRDTWSNLKATTVRGAACEACHRPHSAGGRERLLRHEAEENNCLSCHDGSVAKTNIAGDLIKLSTHPVARTTGVHDPTETPGSMTAHVECSDCHNPHRAASGTASAPNIKPSMRGVRGITGAGTTVEEASYEYQVCYKCHAGNNTVRSPLVDRVLVNTDTSDEFAPRNLSYHPVEARGRNSQVPSLLQPWTTASMIYCTDCHASNSSTGPKGPHGSGNRPMLVRNYDTLDYTNESPDAYALCYGCHNRTAVLSENGPFKYHKKHVQEKHTPCSACHDPHGVSATQATGGSGIAGTHLINFDRRIVLPLGTNTNPIFQDLGTARGSCTLKCHDRNHSDERYPEDDD